MNKTKTISALCNVGENKSDTFRLLHMIRSMAENDACNCGGSWSLNSSADDERYSFTEWSNGIVFLSSVEFKDSDGNTHSQLYSLYEAYNR